MDQKILNLIKTKNLKFHWSMAFIILLIFIILDMFIKAYNGKFLIAGLICFGGYMLYIIIWKVYHPKLNFSIKFVDCRNDEWFYIKNPETEKIIYVRKFDNNTAKDVDGTEYPVTPDTIVGTPI